MLNFVKLWANKPANLAACPRIATDLTKSHWHSFNRQQFFPPSTSPSLSIYHWYNRKFCQFSTVTSPNLFNRQQFYHILSAFNISFGPSLSITVIIANSANSIQALRLTDNNFITFFPLSTFPSPSITGTIANSVNSIRPSQTDNYLSHYFRSLNTHCQCNYSISLNFLEVIHGTYNSYILHKN